MKVCILYACVLGVVLRQVCGDANYKVTVKTGECHFCGTDDDVFVRIIGKNGKTASHELASSGDDFEKGDEYTYYFSDTKYVGEFIAVEVKKTQNFISDDWNLQWMRISYDSGPSFYFSYGRNVPSRRWFTIYVTCPDGYVKIPQGYCEDIDECLQNNGGCEQICSNSHLSYTCSCISGYSLGKDRRTCQDINECGYNNGGCSHICYNTVGSFQCRCPSGMKIANGGRGCVDVDECTDFSPCDLGTSRCVNTPGNYKCDCLQGFESESQYKCRDKNECIRGNSCDASKSICVNIIGDYVCKCKAGYRRGKNNKICKPKSCPALTRPTNGGLFPSNCSTDGGKYPGHCLYFCNNGYTLVGDSRKTCQADGTWSGATPKCKGARPHYIYKGCYKDKWVRAMPEHLGLVDSIRECAVAAAKQGYKAFGLQDGVECWSGPKAHKSYMKYGLAHNCLNGMGGGLSNDVYFFSG